jgi:hypothetical protein
LQFANTFSSSGGLSSNVGPPAAVKTLANSLPGSMGPTVQTIVHNLQQQQQQQLQQVPVVTTVQQVVHGKPTSFSTAALRPVSVQICYILTLIKSTVGNNIS